MASSALNTFTNVGLEPHIREDLAVEIPVSDFVDGTYAKGTVLGKVTANGKYKAYANANSDGSEVAKLILRYAIVVASGVITGLGSQGEASLSAPAFVGGFFRSEDLTGLDAAGLADFGGRIVYGDLTTGLVCLPV